MKRLSFLIVVGLCGVGVLLALGFWQLQRLAWKQSVLSEINQMIQQQAGALPARPMVQNDRYRAVRVEGAFTGAELHALTSIKGRGPGFRLIAAFRTSDARMIMIDRGFIPASARTKIRSNSTGAIEGNLHWPRETDSFTPAPNLPENIWYARDVPAMAQVLGTEAVLVIARTHTGDDIVPIPVDTAGIPNNHLQYAITWFSLALIWAAMIGYFLRYPRWTSKG